MQPSLIRAAARVRLFNLSPAEHSQHAQKRLGRGQGSGRGGTSGRGHKGQKARAGNGKPKAGFEGGQTPIVKLFPKRGFVNPNTKVYAPVNLDRIQFWIDQGRLTSTPEKPITARELLLSGCIHDAHDGIKVLGDGAENLKTPIHITPSRASKTAIRAIEKLGGSAAPTKKTDILWYTSWKSRGYLSPEALSRMPVVEDRWKELSKQLLTYKQQGIEVQK
ncbi:hypothetical protein QCA50_002702 [Cerrena zonata]|uniref:Large ribosomal subunit protein uL15/eL18 domain-containing protein n=1 Tax=Cerrena zonata TaxID=2478898 RepID=A0AAW0GUK5_9APHY